MLRALSASVFLSVILSVACPAQETEEPRVTVTAGSLRGEAIRLGERTVYSFKGIPFAAPPVGRLRWRPPQPPERWQGIRDCLEFPPACPQPGDLTDGLRYPNQSEDCLYVNVWSPSLDQESKLPVMVWIHGGGNTIGGSSAFLYDGRHFATSGVVLVSIQYRLGAFGYLAHPALTAEGRRLDDRETSGNYGLMDQVAALEWVRDNIDRFGGDPSCVTIFGESAGAANVTLLMSSPLAQGLFHRAIAESGYFGENIPPLDGPTRLRKRSAHETGLEFARQLGIEGADEAALQKLREFSPEQLLKVPLTIGVVRVAGGAEDRLRLGPVVDGYVLPREPEAVWREGKMARVPLIAGSQLDDGSVFRLARTPRVIGYGLILRSIFGTEAAKAEEIFPAKNDEEVGRSLHRLITVLSFRAPARRLVRWVENAGGEAYLYHFARNPKRGRSLREGVFHGLEIGYVFKTLAAYGDETDRLIADDLHQRWVNFAASGDPNKPANAWAKSVDLKWPPYRTNSDEHLEIGDRPTIERGLDREACDLFDEIAARR